MLLKGLLLPQLIQDSQVKIFWSPSSTEVLSFLNYSSLLQTSYCNTVSRFHPTCLMALWVYICIWTQNIKMLKPGVKVSPLKIQPAKPYIPRLDFPSQWHLHENTWVHCTPLQLNPCCWLNSNPKIFPSQTGKKLGKPSWSTHQGSASSTATSTSNTSFIRWECNYKCDTCFCLKFNCTTREKEAYTYLHHFHSPGHTKRTCCSSQFYALASVCSKSC